MLCVWVRSKEGESAQTAVGGRDPGLISSSQAYEPPEFCVSVLELVMISPRRKLPLPPPHREAQTQRDSSEGSIKAFSRRNSLLSPTFYSFPSPTVESRRYTYICTPFQAEAERSFIYRKWKQRLLLLANFSNWVDSVFVYYICTCSHAFGDSINCLLVPVLRYKEILTWSFSEFVPHVRFLINSIAFGVGQ